MIDKAALNERFFRWSLDLARAELRTGFPRVRSLPSLAAHSFVAALDQAGEQEKARIVDELVRSFHDQATPASEVSQSGGAQELLADFRMSRLAALRLPVGAGLDARLFGRHVELRARKEGLIEVPGTGSRLLVFDRVLQAGVVRTSIGVQTRPFYFQSFFDKAGQEVIERQSFLRLLGISSQTIFDEAHRGEEATCLELFWALIREFEDWSLGAIPESA